MYSRDAAIAPSSWDAFRLVAVRPHMRVVTVTTGPSKQEAEGGGGEEVGGRGGAFTKPFSTLGFGPAGVGEGVELGGLSMGLGPGAGTATTVAEGLVVVIGAGDATGVGGKETPGEGIDMGGCAGAGAGAGGTLHDLEGPVGTLHVSVHCDDFTRLTVEACTRF